MFPSFDWNLSLLYWIIQLDFHILLKEFGTDCLGLVLLWDILKLLSGNSNSQLYIAVTVTVTDTEAIS